MEDLFVLSLHSRGGEGGNKIIYLVELIISNCHTADQSIKSIGIVIKTVSTTETKRYYTDIFETRHTVCFKSSFYEFVITNIN